MSTDIRGHESPHHHHHHRGEVREPVQCVKVEVDVLGSPVSNSPYGLCGRKATLSDWTRKNQSSGAVWNRGGRPGLPVSNSPYGLCGRKTSMNEERRVSRLAAKVAGTYIIYIVYVGPWVETSHGLGPRWTELGDPLNEYWVSDSPAVQPAILSQSQTSQLSVHWDSFCAVRKAPLCISVCVHVENLT